MKVANLHGWEVTTAEARQIQESLAPQVSRRNEVTAHPRFIAGVDVSVPRTSGLAKAAVVVLDYPRLDLVENVVHEGKITFPYIPGLLAFREAPVTLAAFEKLTLTPDLVIVDGQGLAHPRRMGIACHLGLFLGIPTIGCAKSLLCGRYEEPEDKAGNYTRIMDDSEVIGAALRTKAGERPVYVSIGHKVSLDAAIYWVLQCTRGHRLPEPTRLAHLAAGGNLSQKAIIPPDTQMRLME